MLNASMAKKLLIHIGTGKAGSTAIQNFCSSHTARLKELDVHYWGLNLEGSNDPGSFPWQCHTGTPLLQKLPNQKAAQQLQQALTKAVDQLPEGATALWSNESIYERPTVYIPLLKAIADRPDVDLLVIAYARNHTDYIASAYKQWGIKHKTYQGQMLGFRDWITIRQEFLSYGKRLAPWDSAFGDRFRLVNYNTIGDVVAHISQYLPAAAAALYKPADLQVNASPPHKLLALYALYNNQFDDPVSPQAFQALRQRVPQLRQFKQRPFPPLQQLYPSAAELRQAQEQLAEDAALVNTMLRRHGQPPLPDGNANAAQTPPQPNTQELGTALLQQLMAVVVAQDQRISELQKQLATSP